jgi:hypothetical protein
VRPAIDFKIIRLIRVRFEFETPGIDNDGVEAFAQGLKDTKITHINMNLGFNDIGNAGIQSLVEALKNTKLTLLDLRIYKIKKEGIQTLAKCLKDTQIPHLNCSNISTGNMGA